MSIRKIIACAALAAGGFSIQAASAATMHMGGWDVAWPDSQASSDGTYVTLTVLVDGGSSFTVLQKVAVYTDRAVDGRFQPVSLTFTQTSDSAAKRLLITQENLTNASGHAWTGFDFILEGGSTGSAGLPYFDTAYSFGGAKTFSIAPFTTVSSPISGGGVRNVSLGGGTLADNTVWRPGALSGELAIVASPIVGGHQQFTLYERPDAIPEPSSLALAGVGAMALATRRRRTT